MKYLQIFLALKNLEDFECVKNPETWMLQTFPEFYLVTIWKSSLICLCFNSGWAKIASRLKYQPVIAGYFHLKKHNFGRLLMVKIIKWTHFCRDKIDPQQILLFYNLLLPQLSENFDQLHGFVLTRGKSKTRKQFFLPQTKISQSMYFSVKLCPYPPNLSVSPRF